ncbi:MAG: type II toxin-antitoxin system HicA family toxin [Deinococcota bacterium]
MSSYKKLLATVLRGNSDVSIRFDSLRKLLMALGFEERIKGDHHIFTRANVKEILNLQPKNAKAKPYQVKQVRNIILKYKLGGDIDGQN